MKTTSHWITQHGGRSSKSSHKLIVLALAGSTLAFSLTGCNKPAGSQPPAVSTASKDSKQEVSSEIKPAVTADSKTAVTSANPAAQVLVFRNVRSWRRDPDFEEVLMAVNLPFDVKPSSEMGSADLSPYSVVIIPGAQWQDAFYRHYAENGGRFDSYVTNGGTLLLELNGAERDGITLPRDVTMTRSGSRDNIMTVPEHPILAPLGGKNIHANYASHGYLENVPQDAIVLVTEMDNDQPDLEKPTFIEYAHGKGRVIAACQCFHDQDGSGRGPLMESAINYASEKHWFSPKK